MLPPFIIEQIRKREEEERRRGERPVVHLPIPNRPERRSEGERGGDSERHPERPKRGVVIIDLVN